MSHFVYFNKLGYINVTVGGDDQDIVLASSQCELN